MVGIVTFDQDEPFPGDPVSASGVARLAGADRAEFVWRNDGGGFTFRLWPGGDYLTWVPNGQRERLEAARERSVWVRWYVAVPDFSPIRPGLGGWWVTSASLPGQSAVSPRWSSQPDVAVRAIATGLRRLHDDAPVAGCPFIVERATLFERCLARVQGGDRWRDAPDDYLYAVPDERAIRLLDAARSMTPDLVVCHGDPCSPNTIIGDDGLFVGIVDIAELAVMDRWTDLAVAAWSITWNYGSAWEPLFYREYGIAPDQDMIDAFRIVWNTGVPVQ
jgi:kanamycin kinase